MTKDTQVIKLRQLLGDGMPLYRAAWKVGMDAKTAQKYRDSDRLPSESFTPKTWRTREDPFQEVWPELLDQLVLNPGLQAKTLFEDLQRRFPGRFPDGQLRTLQRKIKAWRATEGPPKEVFFDQVHTPGALCASDFTSMNDLHITLAGQAFDHLVYHFVLTYSNWETGSVCFSESFESLSQGLQDALWGLGGVPRAHRTDRLTAAVNNLGDRDLFQQRYRALLAHYGLTPQAIQARKANQNGDVEQSHHRFKRAMDQALMLRGGRDFADRAAYEVFLHRVFAAAQQRASPAVRRGTTAAERPPLAARGRLASAPGAGHAGEYHPDRLEHLLGAEPTHRGTCRCSCHGGMPGGVAWRDAGRGGPSAARPQETHDQLSARDRLVGAQAGGFRGLSASGRDVPDRPVSPGL